MFTGLVETTGKVENFVLDSRGARINYFADFTESETIKIGNSIALNGVCLTVTGKKNNLYSSDIMKETLSISNLKNLKKGDTVNLERAAKINSRLDGHIVSGHVDAIATVKSIIPDGFSKRVELSCDNELVILKGSICINGISLTVSKVTSSGFEVSLIPETINNTNLKNIKIGDIVNIEFDLIGKCVKKFICQEEKFKITEDFLKENGF